MKGSTVAAMVLAAAAASAATIFGLKKAHEKKLAKKCESACDFDAVDISCDCDENACDCDAEGETCCCGTEESEAPTEAPEEPEEKGCCADGVCSFDSSADAPAEVQMPDHVDLPEDEDEEA